MMLPCLKQGSTPQSTISLGTYSLDTTVSYTENKREWIYTATISLPDLVFRPVCAGGDSFPDMPTLHYREAYEPAIMYQHLSLWDALSFTEGVRFM